MSTENNLRLSPTEKKVDRIFEPFNLASAHRKPLGKKVRQLHLPAGGGINFQDI
jgi:hypothetical protein